MIMKKIHFRLRFLSFEAAIGRQAAMSGTNFRSCPGQALCLRKVKIVIGDSRVGLI